MDTGLGAYCPPVDACARLRMRFGNTTKGALQHLYENSETTDLPRAVNVVDSLWGNLNDMKAANCLNAVPTF